MVLNMLGYLTCGLYYIHITIVNDDSRIVRMTLQIVALPTLIILMCLEAPMIVILTTQYNICGTGIT